MSDDVQDPVGSSNPPKSGSVFPFLQEPEPAPDVPAPDAQPEPEPDPGVSEPVCQ